MLSSYELEWDDTPCLNECEVDGFRFIYDGCNSHSLEHAINFYTNHFTPKLLYVGSGYKTWHNGRESNWKELHHFFVYQNRVSEIKTRFRNLKLKKLENV